MKRHRQAAKTRSQPAVPDIQLQEGAAGEVTLSIDGAQAMQGWERDLMHESADILCAYGSQFLEVGLGFGFSALRIASNPATRRHRVIEKYPRVIELFRQQHPQLPETLELIQADFFDYVMELEPGALDGIFFDPALPMVMWDDASLWERVMPRVVAALRPGGVFIPFFSTRPVIRRQFRGHFDRILVERRRFQAYQTTNYTYANAGDAYIQCFIKVR